MPASTPRRRPTLSPSRAKDFQQCPLMFRLKVVDKIPSPPSVDAARGTLVHAVLEGLFTLEPAQRTPEQAAAMIPARWEAIQEETPVYATLIDESEAEAFLGSADARLQTYFTLEDPQRLQPAEREQWVHADLDGGPRLGGIVDRLDVAPSGAVRVVDYKTGRSPRPGYEEGALFQMRFYALVLLRERGVLPAMLQLMYLRDGRILRNEPSEHDMGVMAEQLRSLWSAIREAARTGNWAPRRTPLCPWCNYQALCPLFGGQAPALDPSAVERAIGVVPET